MPSRPQSLLQFVLAGAALFAAASGHATVIDLTGGGAGASGGALLQSADASAGTGAVNAFVQVSSAGNLDQTRAYNTTVNGVLDNGAPDSFNRALALGEVPRIKIDNLLYREFLLDINEDRGRGRQYLSLDEVQVFLGGTPNGSVASVDAEGLLQHDGTRVYDLEAGLGHWVALDAARNSGSGSADLYLYLLDSLFAAYAGDTAVTLYSHFGRQGDDPEGFSGDFNTSGGFEEWAVRSGMDHCVLNPTDALCTDPVRPPLAEPAGFALLALGLLGLGFARRRVRG